MQKVEINFLKVLYMFLVIFNLIALITIYEFITYIESMLIVDAFCIGVLSVRDVITELGEIYLRLKFKGDK